jgi:hypothetical protein
MQERRFSFGVTHIERVRLGILTQEVFHSIYNPQAVNAPIAATTMIPEFVRRSTDNKPTQKKKKQKKTKKKRTSTPRIWMHWRYALCIDSKSSQKGASGDSRPRRAQPP